MKLLAFLPFTSVTLVPSQSLTVRKTRKWSPNGEGAYESGQKVDALPVGTHKVSFSDVVDWTAPESQDLTVVKDETASVSAVYVRHVGSVSVTLDGPKDAAEPER